MEGSSGEGVERGARRFRLAGGVKDFTGESGAKAVVVTSVGGVPAGAVHGGRNNLSCAVGV